MGYYLAPALEVLRSEVNQRWPRRDKGSDGWIGDAAHQATKSDHNPNSRGSVNALDVDADGIHFPTVLAAIVRHPSARYVIFERRLYHRLRGWRSEPYSGVNPHTGHFHISIDQTRTAEQDRRPWGLLEDDDMKPEDLRDADVFPNGYGDAKTNPTIAFGTFVRNVGRDTEATRKELAELRTEVKKLADRPAAAIDYDKLAAAVLRAVLTPPADTPTQS